MNVIKTCLLVTDDPDDHQTFTEAIGKINDQLIVLIVLDSEKALTLMASERHQPDYIIIDLSTNGLDINSFLEGIRGSATGGTMPIMVYGNIQDFSSIKQPDTLTFISKEYEYSELQDSLKSFIGLT